MGKSDGQRIAMTEADKLLPCPFRKKPVVITAIQWTGENLRDVIAFTGWHPSASNKWSWEEYEEIVRQKGLKIFTLEGHHMASVGDWIIRGVKGEFYPCKPDIFEQTYEPAQASSASPSAEAVRPATLIEELQMLGRWHNQPFSPAEERVRERIVEILQLLDLTKLEQNADTQVETAGHPYVSPGLGGEVRTPAVSAPDAGVEEPKRHSLVGDALHGHAMGERPNGNWVTWKDYDALRERLAEIGSLVGAEHGESVLQAVKDHVDFMRIIQEAGAFQKQRAEQAERDLEAALASGLTFTQFRKANVARCVKWHPKGIASWSPADWLTAVTGELGELASLLKMRNRERDGLVGNKFSPTDKQIADELADVITYLDLLAEVLGVDLGEAVVEKFNEVSIRCGFPDRIIAKAEER